MLLQHTERRVLVIKGQLRDELNVFFADHDFHLSDHLHNEEFLTRLAYLGGVFSRLNDLNLGLQGLSNYIQCAGQN